MITAYTYSCRIERVVDGDTLDIELDLGFHIKMKERVRLLDVNAPEMFGSNAVPEGKLFMEHVTAWVEEKSKTGRFVYVSRKYNARDKYGRSLGIIVWIDDSGVVREELNEAVKKFKV